jgi:hypothetical protein
MSKKCKNCREPFTPIRSTLEKYCSKSECLRVFVAEAKSKAWQKTKKEKKAELMTVQDWIKIAQTAFNAYIRERDKDKGCISCGKPLVGKFDAGHFYNANNHYGVRFHPDNVWGQCVKCNQHDHGSLIKYREGLLKRIGHDGLAWLESFANDTRKFTIDELKEITATYKKKLKELKQISK